MAEVLPRRSGQAQKSEAEEMTNLEIIQAMIERTDTVALEEAAFDPVPMLEKAKTMALLFQARALERIADSLEMIVRAGSFE